jgi:hypothetical protein
MKTTTDESVRLKLKKTSEDAGGKTEILTCASLTLGVYFCRVFAAPDGFSVIVKDKADADKLLTKNSQKI